MNRILTTLFAILLIQFLVVNKTYSDEGEVKDCFEKLNRATFAFNQTLDGVIFQPIASLYRKLPSPAKTGVSNSLTNLSHLLTIPNNVIQTVGYMSDYEKLTQAKELLVDVGKYNKGRYKRISEPYNQGFKQNPTQYIVIFWERV